MTIAETPKSLGAWRRTRRAIADVLSFSRAMTAFASRRYRISGTPCGAQAALSPPAARGRPTRSPRRRPPRGHRATPMTRGSVPAQWRGRVAGFGLRPQRRGRRAAASPPAIAPTRRPWLFPPVHLHQVRYTKRIYHTSPTVRLRLEFMPRGTARPAPQARCELPRIDRDERRHRRTGP